ncbi:hypothetical protein NE237_007732 [Protea cynaroides]|uniref:Bet v I/Major latex protein domain-containing protein n=1 Tax=Protea cynaroides TaxID=273540 RepID=A0A9Q0KPS3_9MAGN|nr:hypothetical protein NE237_007732 [Protea cynaroides]
MADTVATFEVEIEIKTPAQKFFNIFADHVNLLPQVVPDFFKSTTVVKGDGKSVGSIVDWEYILDSSTVETARQTIEAIDEENMVLTIKFYGGDLGRKFHTYRPILKTYKKGGKNYVKWSLDHKKTHDEIADPHNYMEFIENFTKAFDSRLANANVAV